MDDKFQQAITFIKSGDKERGGQLLAEVVKNDPKNLNAWLWLSSCVKNDKQRIYCLQKALEIDPNHQAARSALSKLQQPAPLQKMEILGKHKKEQIAVNSNSMPTMQNEKYVKEQHSKARTESISLFSTLSKNKGIIAVLLIAIILIGSLGIVISRFFGNSPTQLTNSLRAKASNMPNNANCNGFSFSNLSYDVQKTNSLVSPYVGIVSGSFEDSGRKFDFIITLAYQDGKWISNNAQTSSNTVDASQRPGQNLLNAASNLLLTCLD